MVPADVLRESERNRLLRRTDWRFLLPNPRPARTICFGSERVAMAMSLVSEHVLTTRQGHAADSASYDLAVAINPDAATLAAAWAALRPGGACYTEWYVPTVGGLHTVRRRLQAAGFNDVACYWPWPWPTMSPASFWLPLDGTAAVRYFLGAQPRAQAPARRLLHAARRLVWRTSLRLGFMAPVCATAHKAAPPPAISGTSSRAGARCAARVAETSDPGLALLDTIRLDWESWGLGAAPDHLSWLLLTGGQRSVSKAVGLVFAEPEPRPRLAVKMARTPEASEGLAREAATLGGLETLGPGRVTGVPRVLFRDERQGLAAVVQTALTGSYLFECLQPETYRDLALKATAWLERLAGRPVPAPASAWWNRLIEPVLTEFSTSFGSVADAGLLRETRSILATLGHLPLVYEQRDFSPWNVLVANGTTELVVLDWEGAVSHGLPALDLVYFLSYLAFFYDGCMAPGGGVDVARCRSSYRTMLTPSSVTGRILAECQERYAWHIGLDPAALRPLRVLTWLVHSRSEYRRVVADTGGTPSSELLRESLFLGLWQDELRHGGRSA